MVIASVFMPSGFLGGSCPLKKRRKISAILYILNEKIVSDFLTWTTKSICSYSFVVYVGGSPTTEKVCGSWGYDIVLSKSQKLL